MTALSKSATFQRALSRISALEPAIATTSTLYSLAQSKSSVQVDTDIAITETDGALASYAESNYTGSGSIEGLYGKGVVPTLAPPAVANFTSDLTPRHLPMLNQAQSPVVVVVGDSHLAHLNNQEDAQGMLAFAIEKAIRNQAGNKTVTLYNRAIGGQGLPNLNSTPTITVYPPWYTTPANPWLSYVQALNPDVVIIAMGMNTCTDPVTELEAIRTTFQGWAKIPDLVWCTPLVPSPNSSNPTWNTIADQEARLEQQSVIRHFALKYDDGLLDFGRMHAMVRDGYDPRNNYVLSNGYYPTISNGACGAGYYATSGAWLLTISNATWATDGTNVVAVKIGAGADDVVFLSKVASNTVRINVYSGNGASDPAVLLSTTDVTTFNVVSGNYQIMVEFSDNVVTVRDKNDALSPTQYGAYNPPVVFQKTYRRTNRFNSTVITTSTPRPLVSARFDRGYPMRVKPSALNGQLWGYPSTSGTDTYGGSAYNHFGSKMAGLVLNAVLNCAQWFGLSSKILTYSPTITPSGGAFTTISGISGRWSQVGKRVTVHIGFQIATVGTGTGTIQITLPKNPKSGITTSGCGVVNGGGSTKAMMVVANSGNNNLTQATLYDGTSAIGAGYFYQVDLTYEVD